MKIKSKSLKSFNRLFLRIVVFIAISFSVFICFNISRIKFSLDTYNGCKFSKDDLNYDFLFSANIEGDWVAQQAFDDVNKYRNSNRLANYEWSNKAFKEAQKHNEEQIRSGRILHEDFSKRCENIGAWSCAENIAAVWNTSTTPGTDAVNMWINSAGHRRNLEGSYKYMGVAGKKSGKYWWFTAIFYNSGW